MCFPKKLMSDQTSARLGKLHGLKIKINYLNVEVVLQIRILAGHNF